MQKKIIGLIFLFFIFLFSTLFAINEIDSLKVEITNVKNDYEKADLLIEIGKSCVRQSDFENINIYGKELLGLSKNLNYTEGLARANFFLGYFDIHKKDYQNASEKLEKSLHYLNNNLENEDDYKILILLAHAYKRMNIYDKAIENNKILLDIYKNENNQKRVAFIYGELGNSYFALGDFDKALEFYLESLKIREQFNNTEDVIRMLNNIALLYLRLDNNSKALDTFIHAYNLAKESNIDFSLGTIANNIGIIYKDYGKYDEAMKYLQEALEFFQKSNDKEKIATIYINTSEILKRKKEYTKALTELEKAEKIFSQGGSNHNQGIVYNSFAEIYYETGKYKKALSYLDKSFLYVSETKAKDNLRKAFYLYSEIYEKIGDFQKSNDYLKNYITVNDSMFNADMSQKFAELQTKYETEKKQRMIENLENEGKINALKLKESELEVKKRTNMLFLTSIILFLIAILLIISILLINRIRKEREKSDNLLLNVLPPKIANDLKERGRTEPRLYENVTILFSDFCGFTNKSEVLSPQELIGELNEMFTAFDKMLNKYSCERIKTVGDSYIAGCGLHLDVENHAENIVRLGIDMINYLKERNNGAVHKWEIKIGVHSGKLVGGVVGVTKFIFDVFGDAVNTTYRMERYSEAMKINISDTTYELVKDNLILLAEVTKK